MCKYVQNGQRKIISPKEKKKKKEKQTQSPTNNLDNCWFEYSIIIE